MQVLFINNRNLSNNQNIEMNVEGLPCIANAGLKIDEFSRAKMDATAKELMEEKTLAYSCLG